MRVINAKPGIIAIGKQGENNATQIVFDVSAWTDADTGTFQLLHQRKTDTEPHAVVVTYAAGKVSWMVANTEVAVPGYGKAELQLYHGTTLTKSETWLTRAYDSISGASGTTPEPWASWVEDVLAAGSAATASAQQASISKSQAQVAAGSAETSAATATTKAAAAQTSADTASSAALQAQGYRDVATGKAADASAYATAALASQTAAETAQATAQQSASEAESSAASAALAQTAAENAKLLATTASSSASQASRSASLSETAARESAAGALAAKTAAETAQAAAEAAQTAAETAKDTTVSAKDIAVLAKTDAQTAAASAAASASAAGTDAETAATAAGEAQASAESISASSAQIETNRTEIIRVEGKLDSGTTASTAVDLDSLPLISYTIGTDGEWTQRTPQAASYVIDADVEGQANPNFVYIRARSGSTAHISFLKDITYTAEETLEGKAHFCKYAGSRILLQRSQEAALPIPNDCRKIVITKQTSDNAQYYPSAVSLVSKAYGAVETAVKVSNNELAIENHETRIAALEDAFAELCEVLLDG